MAHLSCEHLRAGVCAFTGMPAPRSMCEHCRRDRTGLFRAGLEASRAKRDLRQRLTDGGDHFTCQRFGGLEVDARFCAVCRRNPVLRQKLASHRAATLRTLNPCLHRGREIGTEHVTCCGGRSKEVPLYACTKHGHAHRYTCIGCPDYRPGRKESPAAVGCVTWPQLWQVHRGRTVLVLACGPSVRLPGEDPDPERVDPHDVEYDVVLSTNWAWKWYARIIDYQLCYDVTPCQGWRPPHLKLLTVVRPRESMAVIERCRPYCVFPATDYGPIARGKKLPSSRNSGFAALAMAAYMGASRIRVVGMDFAPAGERMHFYPETDFDVRRRVKSFGRNKERVQTDLTRLLAQIRGMGIEVENLSPISTLDWS